MNRAIVWFKTDLRIQDNETLVRAIKQSDEIIPVYCFDEAHFKTIEFGFNKTENFKSQFLLESLASYIAEQDKQEQSYYRHKNRHSMRTTRTNLNKQKHYCKR